MPDTDSASPAEMTDTELLDEATALATSPEPLGPAGLERLQAMQTDAPRRGLADALDQRITDACVAATKLPKRGAA